MITSEVVDAAAAAFNLTPEELYGPSRGGYICRARFAVYKVLFMYSGSAAQVGRWLGRDRSTIKHGVYRAEYIMGVDPHYARVVEKLARIGAEQ